MNKKIVNNSEKGQVLLFVIVAMTIVLALGVGVSLDTISSITQVSNTDTSQRSLAAAEGGVEKFLVLDNSLLRQFADIAGSPNDGRWPLLCANIPGVTTEPLEGGGYAGCKVTYQGATGANGDPIDAKAVVKVEEYTTNTTTGNGSEINILRNDVGEFDLRGYTHSNLTMCWNHNNAIDLYVTGHTYVAPQTTKIILRCQNCGNGSQWDFGTANVLTATSSGNGYTSCRQLQISQGHFPSNPAFIRVRPLFKASPPVQSVEVAIFPQGGHSLPVQGYKITSVGSLTDNTNVQVTRTVTVYKSNPTPIGLFDFSVYSGEDLYSIL